ncbi:MAG: hypothetical protein HYV63_33270 [Candidatus Schekmanbacteria bacterium]|nr:hypothetical protein [Candidatus Schekmanbacteria bacterium]
MKLLVDVDAFCKLQVAGLLSDAAGLVAARIDDCGRLPALPHMLRRGKLRKQFGGDVCEVLISVAEAVPVIPQPSDTWLDKLIPIEGIDVGEAQLFAAAAEGSLLVVSGDKRALRALKDVEGFAGALAGRIVVLEAVLVALCDHLGADAVRDRIAPLAAADKMVQVCFSIGNPSPREALISYYQSLAAELDPLVLWDARAGGAP